MRSSTFFIVLCGLLLVSTEALRFQNRNLPDDRRDINGNGQENGDQEIDEQQNGQQEIDQQENGQQENGQQENPEQQNAEHENGEQDRPLEGPMGGRDDRDGMRDHGHGNGFRLPFLANATDEERKKFFAIFKDRTLDKASKEAAIEQLVATLDPAIQEAYNTWKQEKEAALAEKVAALSPEAKQAYDALQQIQNATTLSAEEKRTQIREFMNNQTEEVRDELKGLMWGGKRGFGGGRFGGRQGGQGENEDRPRNRRHGAFSFLSNVTDPAVLAEFRAIFRNRSLDRTEKESAIEQLVATLDPSIQQAYNDWKAKREADLAAKVAKLSPEARTAYDSLKAIKDNTALSAEEKRTQIKTLMDPLTQEVKDELRSVFGGRRGGPGGRRGGQGDREGGDLGGDNTGNGGFGRGGRGFGGRNFGGRF